MEQTDELNYLALDLAQAQGHKPLRAKGLKAVLNQMGQYVALHETMLRQDYLSGNSLRRLISDASSGLDGAASPPAMQEPGAQDSPGDSGESSSEDSGDDGSSSSEDDGDGSGEVSTTTRDGAGAPERPCDGDPPGLSVVASRYGALEGLSPTVLRSLSLSYPVESTGEVESRSVFLAQSGVKSVAGRHETHIAWVGVPVQVQGPASSTSTPKVQVSIGSYARSCFALEVHRSLLSLAYSQLEKPPDPALVRKGLAAGHLCGAPSRPFKLTGQRGGVVEITPDLHPSARAVARSSAAQALVWSKSFTSMNAAYKKQKQALAVIAAAGAGASAENEGALEAASRAYLESGVRGACEYYKFRQELAQFLRLRSLFQSDIRDGGDVPAHFSSFPTSGLPRLDRAAPVAMEKAAPSVRLRGAHGRLPPQNLQNQVVPVIPWGRGESSSSS